MMSDQPTGGPAMPPPAPPMQPGEIAGAQSRWPGVVGVISIVLGAGGALIGCFGVVSNAFLPDLMESFQGFAQNTGGNVTATTYEAAARYTPWIIATNAANLGVAVMLLVAGIGLVQRRAYGPRWSVTWALARLAMVAPQTWVGYVTSKAQLEAMGTGTGPGAMPPGFGGMMPVILMAGIVVGVVWSSIYPVFTLVWMRRAAVRRETSTWA